MSRQNNNVYSDVTNQQLEKFFVTSEIPAEMSVLKVKFLTQIPLILRAAQQIQSRY
jgi:hypothetical protein